MASSIRTAAKLVMLQGIINASGTYKVALFGAAYVAADSYSTTNEVSGAGYTAGGKALTGVTTTTSGTTAFADASDVSWTGATITARYAVIYDTGSANRVVAIFDFGADQSVIAGTLTVQWPAGDAANAMLRVS